MDQWSERRGGSTRKVNGIWRLWAALVLLIVFLACSVFALHALFSDNSRAEAAAWSFTFSAVSSLALVIVTAVLVGVTAQYVFLTRRLVQVQGDFTGIARARQRVMTATELSSDVAKALGVVRDALQLFPLSESKSPNATAVIGIAEMNALSWEFTYARASLPLELQDDCDVAIEALNGAYRCQVALYESLRLASIIHMQPSIDAAVGSTWGWDQVRAQYDSSPNPPATWEDIAKGSSLDFARESLLRLRTRTAEYLSRDAPDEE